jgi:hypothetical protein
MLGVVAIALLPLMSLPLRPGDGRHGHRLADERLGWCIADARRRRGDTSCR